MLEIWVISTGTEILQGLYADTNAQWLSQRLNEIGSEVHRHMAVPDDPHLLRHALEEASASADLVIISGGLGPTRDDVNRDVIVDVWDSNLSEDAEALRRINESYRRRGQEVSQASRRQAWIPGKAMVLQNDHGTAPGFFIPQDRGATSRAAILALPGPPRELRPMFDLQAVPLLKDQLEGWGIVHTSGFTVLGFPESAINDRLHQPGDDEADVKVTLLSNPGRVDIRLIINASSQAELDRLRREWYQKVYDRIGINNIFCEGREFPEEVIAKLLVQCHVTLAVAESCTGGMLASVMTSVPGASAWFRGGVIAYDDDIKKSQLAVPEEMLRNVGAVSPEVAGSMAEGVCRICSADRGLGITGIAGPDGGSLEKPVGLVYLGLAGSNSDTVVMKHEFSGDRDMVRRQAVIKSIELLGRSLKGISLENNLP
jgi:nicotinamide-nucleotide amidase